MKVDEPINRDTIRKDTNNPISKPSGGQKILSSHCPTVRTEKFDLHAVRRSQNTKSGIATTGGQKAKIGGSKKTNRHEKVRVPAGEVPVRESGLFS